MARLNAVYSLFRRWKAAVPVLGLLAVLVCPLPAELSDQMDLAAQRMRTNSPEVHADSMNVDLEPMPRSRGEETAPLSENMEIGSSVTPENLLETNPKVREFLGESPSFIYDPKGKPDPMLVPWARALAMARELDSVAQKARDQQDWDRVNWAYRQILRVVAALPEEFLPKVTGLDKLVQVARQGLAETEGLSTLRGGESGDEIVRLPIWVRENTKGIIYSKKGSICLVGPHTLEVGDKVPSFQQDIIVEAIEPDAVHYKVRDQIFVVHPQEGE